MNPAEEKMRILIVDDEAEFLESSARALGRRGFEVSKALDGSAALAMVKDQEFDAMVLDLKMPGLDGEEVFRQVQKDHPDLPVIMLTGHGSVPHAFTTAKKGIADYIAKPCDMDELASRIRKVIQNAKARERTARGTPGEGRIRLLLVDDEVGLLESLGSLLGRRQMDVSTAGTPTQAFEILNGKLIDVVVLDLRLPEMDGLEMLKLVKKNYPETEVLLLTGYPSVNSALEGIKLGAYAYVTKPVEPEELVTKIRSAYERRQESVEKKRENILDEIKKRYAE
jgi:DNA-binding NtrC family response regulator